MAGIMFKDNNGLPCCIDFADADGSAFVNGIKWRWEFHRFCGPTFLNKDGEPRKIQPSENHPVWIEFQKWLDEYDKENP